MSTKDERICIVCGKKYVHPKDRKNQVCGIICFNQSPKKRKSNKHNFPNDPWNKGLSKETDKRIQELAEIQSKRLTGMSFDKRFGEEKAIISKAKKSVSMKKVIKKIGLEKWLKQSYFKASYRPNIFEGKALNYLNTIYNNKFKYTGDCTFLINGRSPDAYSEELKTVALFHGIYWHLRKYGLEITEENKRSVEKIDSLPFTTAGYKVIFIWEDEIDNLIGSKT